MKKIIFAVLLSACVFSGSVFAAKCGDPLKFTKSLVNSIVKDAKVNKDQEQLLKVITKRLKNVADTNYVISRVLGSEYRSLNAAQKKEIRDLLASYVTKGFTGALSQVDSSRSLRFYPYRGKSDQVASIKALYMARSGESVRINFMLSCDQGRWLIQDVSLDGVMLVDGYVAQLRPIVERDGVSGFIKFLKNNL